MHWDLSRRTLVHYGHRQKVPLIDYHPPVTFFVLTPPADLNREMREKK